MNDSLQLPEAFVSVPGLGMPKAWFPVKGRNRVGNLVLFFLFLSASCLLFFYGLYDTYTAYEQHGPAMIDDRLIVPTLISIGLFVLGGLAGWAAYKNWNRGVAVYEKGFVWRDRAGLHPWIWEEQASLTAAITRHYTNGIYTGTTHVYTLLNKQNERLVLTDAYQNVEELASLIEQSIFPLLYDRAAAQYNSGQAVVFGPVAISKSGIVIGKKTYPWPEVQQVSIQQGFLKVSKRDGGWFSGASAAASAIPNLRVLLSIIDQVVGVKTV